jgi:hypothetical protein
MMGQKFTTIVEECLHRLDRGENLPEVLAEYPEQAEQLKPLLLVAMASRAVSVPSPDQNSRRMGRTQMLAEMDQQGFENIYYGESLGKRIQGWYFGALNTFRARALVREAPSYRLAIAALVMVFGVGLVTISASASNLPGGMLGSFASDVQQALGFFISETDKPADSYPGVSFLSGGSQYFGEVRGAKVAFLLDLLEEENKPGLALGADQRLYHNHQGRGGSEEKKQGQEELAAGVPDDPNSDRPDDKLNNSAREYAPGQGDEPATMHAPGQQDGPATDYAPGLVKKEDVGEDLEDEKDKDKEEKDKDKEEKDKDKDK